MSFRYLVMSFRLAVTGGQLRLGPCRTVSWSRPSSQVIPHGLAEAYDRYAAPLYTYCRLMLPDPQPPGAAADAVADTFIIATAKLQGLGDPASCAPGCTRSRGTNACAGSARGRRASPPGRPPTRRRPEVSPPAELRERILKACADDTPTGRAHRASVTHRAGPFGRTGFPKSVIPPGPRWWHEVRRRPRAAAGVAAVAAAVVVAGITTLLIAGGGTHPAHASTVALGGGDFATPSAASSPPGGRPSPSRKPTPASRASSGPGAPTSAADGPTAGNSSPPGSPRSSAPGQPSPSPSRPRRRPRHRRPRRPPRRPRAPCGCPRTSWS